MSGVPSRTPAQCSSCKQTSGDQAIQFTYLHNSMFGSLKPKHLHCLAGLSSEFPVSALTTVAVCHTTNRVQLLPTMFCFDDMDKIGLMNE